jgi:hypothetical protein
MDPARLVIHKLASKKPKTHAEFTGFLDKERPDWIQALIPRRINAPSEYWPQKVFAVATILAAIRNQVAHDSGNKLDWIAAAVEGHAAQLLPFEVPTFYVSKELLSAAARTDLPTDIFLDAVPFPFPALLFMFPKETIRHPDHGECPYLAVSRAEKGQVFSLPLKDFEIRATMAENAVMVTTYLPEECGYYHKTISVVSGETMKSAFERASKVPFDVPGGHLFGGKYASSSVDADFVDRLWLLGVTLVLIMASGEKLLEYGVRLKTVKAKQQGDRPVEYWSPNYLGRIYQAQGDNSSGEEDGHRRPHWRKGHVKSQAYGPKHSLRRIIWIQPYRTGNQNEENVD